MPSLRLTRPRVLLALCVVAVAATCFVRGLSTELDDARARWEQLEPRAYSFVYGHCNGMCAFCPVEVTVEDGSVTAASSAVHDPGCSDPVPDEAPTIDDLFTVAEDQQPWPFGATTTTIAYDPEWAFPTSIDVECGEGTSDCGSGWSVSGFRVLG